MKNDVILPFYMAYPFPMLYQDEDTATRDLTYISQMYPIKAKQCQKRVAQLLDRLDYEGSMIYDEYPDKLQLYKLSNDILERIKREEQRDEPDQKASPEKWEWLGDLIQILLFYEIYKRRHNSRRGILRF